MYQTCGIRPSPTRSQCSPASMSRRSNASHGCTRAASHARDAPPLARCRRQAPAPLCCLRAGDSPELSSRYPRPLEPPPAQEMRHCSPASGDEPPPPLCHQSTSHPPVSLRQGAPTSPLWTRLAPAMQGRGRFSTQHSSKASFCRCPTSTLLFHS